MSTDAWSCIRSILICLPLRSSQDWFLPRQECVEWFGTRFSVGQFTFAKSESPQWPEEVKILKKKNGLTQPPRNTTFASHPYSGLCLAFDFPQISFPTSSSAARKYDFVFGNTTEIIQRCSSLLIRNSLGKLIN